MGNRYLRMFRQAADPGWYLGAHSFPVNTADKKFEDIFPTTNTDSIFLNFFISNSRFGLEVFLNSKACQGGALVPLALL